SAKSSGYRLRSTHCGPRLEDTHEMRICTVAPRHSSYSWKAAAAPGGAALGSAGTTPGGSVSSGGGGATDVTGICCGGCWMTCWGCDTCCETPGGGGAVFGKKPGGRITWPRISPSGWNWELIDTHHWPEASCCRSLCEKRMCTPVTMNPPSERWYRTGPRLPGEPNRMSALVTRVWDRPFTSSVTSASVRAALKKKR